MPTPSLLAEPSRPRAIIGREWDTLLNGDCDVASGIEDGPALRCVSAGDCSDGLGVEAVLK